MNEEVIIRALGDGRAMYRLHLAGVCDSNARAISAPLERLIEQGRVICFGPGQVVLSRCLRCGVRGEPVMQGRCVRCRAGGLQ